jgi:hypothetical protein
MMKTTAPLDYLMEFLTENSALEGLSEPPGALGPTPTGHGAALMDSQKSAADRRPLHVEDITRWQNQLTGSLSTVTSKALTELVEDINNNLGPSRPSSIVDVVQLIADSLHRFHAINPFPSANGRLERLLANYIATFCAVPILIFRARERDQLADGFHDVVAMRLYVADKLREAVFDREGNLLLRDQAFGSTDSYRNPSGGTLLVEWHELLDACDVWRARGER